MATALVPGSFDPVTYGHLDVIERVARFFDRVIVAVIRNPQKAASLFTLEERESMLAEVTGHLGNIQIEYFTGLLVDSPTVTQKAYPPQEGAASLTVQMWRTPWT